MKYVHISFLVDRFIQVFAVVLVEKVKAGAVKHSRL